MACQQKKSLLNCYTNIIDLQHWPLCCCCRNQSIYLMGTRGVNYLTHLPRKLFQSDALLMRTNWKAQCFKNVPNPASPFWLFSRDKCGTKWTINDDKSTNGVLGTQTRSSRMVGADKSTKLGRYPLGIHLVFYFQIALFVSLT